MPCSLQRLDTGSRAARYLAWREATAGWLPVSPEDARTSLPWRPVPGVRFPGRRVNSLRSRGCLAAGNRLTHAHTGGAIPCASHSAACSRAASRLVRPAADKWRGRDGGRWVALSSTRSATRWSAASTRSGPGGAWPRATTRRPRATWRAPATRIHHLDAQPQPGPARQARRRRAIVRGTSRGPLPACLGRNLHGRRGRGSPDPSGSRPLRLGNRRPV